MARDIVASAPPDIDPPTRRDLGLADPTDEELTAVLNRGHLRAFKTFGLVIQTDEQLEAVMREAFEGFVSTSEAKRLMDETEAHFQYLHDQELDERFRAGKDAMRVKKQQVNDAVQILRDARDLVHDSHAWSGLPDRKDQMLARMDELIHTLES